MLYELNKDQAQFLRQLMFFDHDQIGFKAKSKPIIDSILVSLDSPSKKTAETEKIEGKEFDRVLFVKGKTITKQINYDSPEKEVPLDIQL